MTPFTVTDLPTLLFQIERARHDGWCYINQETAMGIASLAVPIRVAGEIGYSLSTSAQINFAAPTVVETFLPDLLGTATRDLRHAGRQRVELSAYPEIVAFRERIHRRPSYA